MVMQTEQDGVTAVDCRIQSRMDTYVAGVDRDDRDSGVFRRQGFVPAPWAVNVGRGKQRKQDDRAGSVLPHQIFRRSGAGVVAGRTEDVQALLAESAQQAIASGRI